MLNSMFDYITFFMCSGGFVCLIIGFVLGLYLAKKKEKDNDGFIRGDYKTIGRVTSIFIIIALILLIMFFGVVATDEGKGGAFAGSIALIILGLLQKQKKFGHFSQIGIALVSSFILMIPSFGLLALDKYEKEIEYQQQQEQGKQYEKIVKNTEIKEGLTLNDIVESLDYETGYWSSSYNKYDKTYSVDYHCYNGNDYSEGMDIYFQYDPTTKSITLDRITIGDTIYGEKDSKSILNKLINDVAINE